MTPKSGCHFSILGCMGRMSLEWGEEGCMVSALLEVTHYTTCEFMIPEVEWTVDYHPSW